ncbi:hypothetical protein BN3662_01046 [Clostridiales bacterium CHKCI006]|nr:hypothetical protein BN3662_01046 [Clostridiales bacterium CHKCI006]
MKSSTYIWIIGCLLGIIVILITYLILTENGVICISFADALSIASTLSSLILSVIAMFYTYYSGRDAQNIYIQIQSAIKEINRQVEKVSDDTKKNSETLVRITDGVQNIISAVASSSEALDTMRKESVSENERREAVEVIEKSKNSMIMFLKKMQEDE